MFFLLLVLSPLSILAQNNAQKKKIGFRAGASFPAITGIGQVKSSNITGFSGGLIFSSPSTKVGYRTELSFLRTGYDYKTSTAKGQVRLNYISLPQLTTYNIGKKLQFQLGAQISYLLGVNADSTSQNPSSSPQPGYGKLMDYYNKLNYGVLGGIEINLVKGLIIGGRYTYGLAKLGSSNTSSPLPGMPPFINKDMKSGNTEFYLGYYF